MSPNSTLPSTQVLFPPSVARVLCRLDFACSLGSRLSLSYLRHFVAHSAALQRQTILRFFNLLIFRFFWIWASLLGLRQ
jgi:hypothetical protein